jgi:ribosome-associated toxin RatA of RatAB toxin-antitoxin module
MINVQKSLLVPYSPSQMFALVDTVERYPEFLPWCGSTALLHRDAQITRATLEINFHGIKQRFTTENPKSEPTWMEIKLVEGPFRSLEGSWRFTELGGRGCKIDFHMRYEFASRLLEKLVGPVFNHIASTLADAFVKRAKKVYG